MDENGRTSCKSTGWALTSGNPKWITRSATLDIPQVSAMPSVHVGAWTAAQMPNLWSSTFVEHAKLGDPPRSGRYATTTWAAMQPAATPHHEDAPQFTNEGQVSCTNCGENVAVNAAAPNFLPRSAPPATFHIPKHQNQISKKTGSISNPRRKK